MARAAFSEKPLTESLQAVLDSFVPLLPGTRLAVTLYDPVTDRLTVSAAHSDPGAGACLQLEEGFTRWVLDHGRMAFSNTPATDDRFVRSPTAPPPAAAAAFPLHAGDRLAGTLDLCRASSPLEEGELELAEALAAMVSAALQRQRLQALAHQDTLTGIGNRRSFNLTLASEMSRATRYMRPLSLVVYDIDSFKLVNDTSGHPAGDALLRGVTAKTRSLTRRTDHIFRTGGDEFAIVLTETGPEGAAVFGERARAGLEEWLRNESGNGVVLSASFGITSFRSGDTAETLIQRADEALLEAKRAGKNRVAVK